MTKKTSPSSPNMTSPGRGTELLRALNAAAASLQRAAHSEAEVFRAFREQVVALGLHGGINLLNATSKRLTLRAVAYPDPISRLLAELEKLTGLKVDGFEFAVDNVDAYQQVVETGQAIFAPNSNAIVAQLLPQAARPFARHIQQVFGAPPAVFAPLISEGKVEGILNVVGAGLTRDDVPAVQAFANHLAIALDNARAISALRESESLLRESQIIAGLGSYVLDFSTGMWKSSDILDKLFGIDETYVRSVEGWADLVHPDERQQMLGYFTNEVIGKRVRFDKEYRIIRKNDGAERWVHGVGELEVDAQNQLWKMHGTITDITERKQAEERLQLQATALDAAANAIMITNRDGAIEWVNPAFTALTGYTPEEAIGKNPRELVKSGKQAQSFYKNLWDTILSGQVWRGEVVNRRKDGSLYTEEQTITPVRDGHGAVTHFIAIKQDITERVRAEKRLATQYAVARALAEFATLAEATPRLLQDICEGLDWEHAEVWSLLWSADSQANVLRCTGTWHPPSLSFPEFETATRQIEFPPGVGLPGRVWSSGKPTWIPDVTQDGNFPRAPIAAKEGLRAGFAFPIQLGSQVLGVMGFLSREIRPPDNDTLQMLTSVSSQISRFIEGKQAEEALRESEERYRTLVETAPDSIFAVSLDGTLVSLNPAFEALTGWPPEEWLGKPFAPFFHPDDLSSGMELFQRILQGETLPPLEWRIRHKSGDYTTVEVTAVPRLEHGQVVGLLGIARDITERKQSEEALRESEEKFSKAFHSNLAMLVLSTLDGKNVDVNQAYTDFLGYSREEILGKSIVDLQIVSVKERQKIFELIQRAGGSLHNAEITVQILDGSLRHILLSVEAISLGSVPHHLATLLDITERKQAEAALIESSAQFRTLFESSPDAIVLIDPHDSWPILDCNTAACQMNGYTRDELIRQFVDVLNLTPGDPAERAEYLERVRQTGILRLETLHRRKDGTMFPVEVSTSLLTLGGRDVILEIDRDITERQQRERELQAVVTVSAALRTAQTQAEMLPIIVDQLLDLLKADGAALVRHDDTTGESIMELVRGALPTTSGLRLPAGEGISGYVISRGQPYLTNDLQSDLRFAGPDVNFGRVAVACWPLIGQGQMVGALWVSRAQPFTENEQRLLSAISDIAANALRRASLHEQTEQRLQHLIALRAIDMTISSSLDLRMTLGVLLGQTVTQLRVDAADVLLLNPHLQRLDYAAGRGFRGGGITRSHLRLGECQAGRAVLERRTIHISNLAEETTFVRAGLLASENFVAHYVTPLIAKGEVKGVLEVFHRAPLAPDPEWLDFLEALAGQAAIAIDNSELFEGLQRSNMELALAYDATIEGWSHALDLRDKETEGHTLRVTEMTLRLARAAGMTEGELVHVRRGALLHDIGKMGVPDHILLKPGKLTDEEWVIMRKHPLFAYELLLPIAYLRPALDIPYSHHEKWDGSGYPRGLMSEQIPLAARLFAVVDVWDALRSDRPYRKGWPEEKVLEHIRALSGTHFDPKAVELFLRVVNEKTEEH